ncbi:MAG TPA: HlyD family efflux transporter periplasmic adaptor subunit, partial [Bryobacteraceae bacterium]|nr:HlyD family efflux transporter periplasmic adaptor subunit [Bryobacteraceae bacterium]
TAPMVGGDLPITSLKEPGERVKPGDIVVEFDTTAQEYNLREAQADLAEAEQQVIKAQADAQASLEETRYQTLATAAEVKTAELEVRKNPILAAVPAKQNEIALEAARNKQLQAEKDFSNKKATADAGVAIQKAAVEKSRVLAAQAQKQIESMTLKAKTAGYVNVQQNSNQNNLYYGQQLPDYHVGDAARSGQAVAQIPDMSNWEVSASIPELDRGHLDQGQKVTIRAAAIPGREFRGHVKSLGGTSGSAWDRRFECRIALDETGPELRPGMTSNILITVESLEDALWIPSQALFESDGRAFVYARTPQGFVSRDVKLVRRSESQAVITGIAEGEQVALSNPDQSNANQYKGGKSGGTGGVMKALTK